eukprot:365687-Chlamydomonas_euryale.AAC.4
MARKVSSFSSVRRHGHKGIMIALSGRVAAAGTVSGHPGGAEESAVGGTPPLYAGRWVALQGDSAGWTPLQNLSRPKFRPRRPPLQRWHGIINSVS